MTESAKKYIDLYYNLKNIIKDFTDEEYDKWLDSEIGIKIFDEMGDAWWAIEDKNEVNKLLSMEAEDED